MPATQLSTALNNMRELKQMNYQILKFTIASGGLKKLVAKYCGFVIFE